MIREYRKLSFIETILLIGLPLVTAIFCIGFGRYSVSLEETITAILSPLTKAEVNDTVYSVIVGIRLPRLLLAMFVGAGLACAGAAFQSLFSNPLATPDTLGVGSGAAFGAVLAMMMNFGMIGVQLMALIFGLLACFLAYTISKGKNGSSIIMIVLAGIVISALFEALVSLLKYLADQEEELPEITYWLLGSMSGAGYQSLLLGIPFILIGLGILFALKWKLNILSLSEDEAKSMGINMKLMRGAIIVGASAITASCVSMCGQVGWVGLLIPHIARMMKGSDNRSVIPLSISLGATYVILMDTFARSAIASEIPISILTSVLGAPFFILLLKKTGGAWT